MAAFKDRCVGWIKSNVSVSPLFYVFTDADGDDVRGEKGNTFSGVGRRTARSWNAMRCLFGLMAKIVFTYGNAVRDFEMLKGNPIIEPDRQTDHQMKLQPIRRNGNSMDPDGSNVEIIRLETPNNYESQWEQLRPDVSNLITDDDGNRGTSDHLRDGLWKYGFQRRNGPDRIGEPRSHQYGKIRFHFGHFGT